MAKLVEEEVIESDVSPEKYTVDEFAALIKEKYPDYAEWDNIELTNAIIEKYPDYKTWVKTEEETISLIADPPVPRFPTEIPISGSETVEVEGEFLKKPSFAWEIDPHQADEPVLEQIEEFEGLDEGEEVEIDADQRAQFNYNKEIDFVSAPLIEEIKVEKEDKIISLEDMPISEVGEKLEELAYKFQDDFGVSPKEMEDHLLQKIQRIDNTFKSAAGITYGELEKMTDEDWGEYLASLSIEDKTALNNAIHIYGVGRKEYMKESEAAKRAMDDMNILVKRYNDDLNYQQQEREHHQKLFENLSDMKVTFTPGNPGDISSHYRRRDKRLMRDLEQQMKGLDTKGYEYNYDSLDKEFSKPGGNYELMEKQPKTINGIVNLFASTEGGWRNVPYEQRIFNYQQLHNTLSIQNPSNKAGMWHTHFQSVEDIANLAAITAIEEGTSNEDEELIKSTAETLKIKYGPNLEETVKVLPKLLQIFKDGNFSMQDMLPDAMWLLNEQQVAAIMARILPGEVTNVTAASVFAGEKPIAGGWMVAASIGDELIISAPNGKVWKGYFDWGHDRDQDAIVENRTQIDRSRKSLLRFIRKNASPEERNEIIINALELGNEVEIKSNIPPSQGGYGADQYEKNYIQNVFNNLQPDAEGNVLGVVQEFKPGYEKGPGENYTNIDRIRQTYKAELDNLLAKYNTDLVASHRQENLLGYGRKDFVEEDAIQKALKQELVKQAWEKTEYLEKILYFGAIKEKNFETYLNKIKDKDLVFYAHQGPSIYGAQVFKNKSEKILDIYNRRVETKGAQLTRVVGAIANNRNSGISLYRRFLQDPKFEFKLTNHELKNGLYYITKDDKESGMVGGRIIPMWVIKQYDREVKAIEGASILYKDAEAAIPEEDLKALGEDIFSGEILGQFIDKNYNDLAAFGSKFYRSGINLLVKIGYGAMELSFINMALRTHDINTVDDLVLAWDQWNQNADASFKTPLSFDEIDGLGSFGEWSAAFIAENWGPIVLSIATYGYGGTIGMSDKARMLLATGLPGLSAGGEQVSKLVGQARDEGVDVDSMYTWVQNFLFSATEMGTEIAFGGPLLKRFDKIIRGNKNWYRKFKEGRIDYIKNKMLRPALGTGTSQVLDGTGESVNTVLGHVYEGDWEHLWEGVPEAFVGSFVLSNSVFLTSSGPAMSGLVSKRFAAVEEQNALQDNYNKINEITDELVVLENKKNDLTQDPTKNKKEVKEQIQQIDEDINILLDERTDKLGESQTILEEIRYKVSGRGIKNVAANQVAKNANEIANLKAQAEKIAKNNTLSNKEKAKQLKPLQEKYNAATTVMNLFNSKAYFGHGFLSLEGGKILNILNRKKATEYTEIMREAEENLRETNPSQESFSKEELRVEAMKVYDAQQFDIQNKRAKEMSDKYNLSYKSYNTESQARKEITKIYNEAIEKETDLKTKELLQEELDGFKSSEKGTSNGFSSDILQTEFVIKENAVKNQKSRTWTHEITHRLSRIILRNDPAKFNALAENMLDYLKTKQPKLLLKMEMENANLYDEKGNIDNEELVSTFFEEMGGGRINLKPTDPRVLYFGALLNESLSKATNGKFNVDFSGGIDILNFFKEMGVKSKSKSFKNVLANFAAKIEKIATLRGKEKIIAQQKIEKDVPLKAKESLTPEESVSVITDPLSTESEVNKAIRSIIEPNIGLIYKALDYHKGKGDITEAEILSAVAEELGSGKKGIFKTFDPSKSKFTTYLTNILRTRRQGIYKAAGLDAKKLKTTSIDTEQARQIEDLGMQAPDEGIDQQKEKPVGIRERKSFTDLKIANKELNNEVKDILIKELSRTALIEGLSEKSILNALNKAIEGPIMKLLKKEMGSITKKDPGFASQQYKDFISENMNIILGAMPLDVIKQKAKSKAWSNIFKIEKLEREAQRVVDPKTGKVTYPGKGIFKIVKPSKKDFVGYFTQGGYTTLIARQKSLTNPIGKELSKISLFEVMKDQKVLEELADRTGLNDNEISTLQLTNILDNVQEVLDDKASEQRSFDVVKFSKALNADQLGEFSKFGKKLIENIKASGKNYSKAVLNQALIQTYYNNPKNKYFKGDEGLKALNEFADELYLPVKKWLKPETQKQLENVRFDDFIFKEIAISKSIVREGIDLLKSLKLTKIIQDFAKAFREGVWQQSQRDLNVGYSTHLYEQNLDKKRDKKETKEYKTAIKDLMDKNPGITLEDAKKYIAKYDSLVTILKYGRGHQVTAGKIGKRYQVWEGNQDFLQNGIGIPGVVVEGKIFGEKIDPETGEVTYKWKFDSITIDGKKLNEAETKEFKKKIKPVQQNANLGKSTYESEYELREKEAQEAWDTMMDYLTYIYDNGTALDFGMALMSLKSNMSTMLKAAAAVEYYYVKDGKVGPLRYEHMIPTEYMALKLAQYFYSGKTPGSGTMSKADLDTLQKLYKVAIIPVSMDNSINVQLQKSMPADWVVEMEAWMRYYEASNLGLVDIVAIEIIGGKNKGEIIGEDFVKLNNEKIKAATKATAKEIVGSGVMKGKASSTNLDLIKQAAIMDKALNIARDPNAPVKKIRVFDFDDTLARTKSNVLYTMPDGTKGKLTAEEFAQRGDQLALDGAKWDFSEFNKVMKGKKGPLFEVAKIIADKRGTQDVFVLTARPQAAAIAIKEFLDGLGLNIPLENITGLEDSSPLAKSGWIVEKAAEGYNDFYFADDHTGNVKAVKKVLDVIDVKSKVQQAKIKFSQTVDEAINLIIEQKTGEPGLFGKPKKGVIGREKVYSAARAQTEGSNKGKFKFFIPPSAEDFTGLLYRMLPHGKEGDVAMAYFKHHLLNPFARAMNDLSNDRVRIMNDFRNLKKELVKNKSIPKNLRKKAIGKFTYEDIVRVMAWEQQGITPEGLSKRDIKAFKKFLADNHNIQLFVDELVNINKGDGYAYPGKNWLAGNITTDLIEGLNTTKRTKYLQEWQQNVDLMFSEKNLNKIEAVFGTKYREALEDMIRRMKTGKNRKSTGSRIENRLLDYINNSIGTVMFLNMRSGLLQTISAINFMNWTFNNPMQAGIAFANQKQYWKDWLYLMNSDYLVDRRNGLKINVSESEIADAARGQKNKPRAIINLLLKKGFLVTQIMDSFAIASGGATFYRNRIKNLRKNNPEMTIKEAEEKAFLEFYDISEESQQSSRPDRISMQQASGAGRIILAFANTPMQYNRIMKKATQDILNGRGDFKTNVSKIVYYGFIQSVIFNALQQALFAFAVDDEEDEKKKEKYYKVADGMLDSLLRGIGIGGQIVLTIKKLTQDVYMRYQKSIDPNATWYEKRPDYEQSVWKVLEFSPPLSIKIRKLRQAAKNWEYNKWRHDKDPWSLEDPAWLSMAYVISATTNVPLDRLILKAQNVGTALEADQEWWRRVALFSGYKEWELESSKERKERKDEEKTEKKLIKQKDDPSLYSKSEQEDILKQHGKTEEEIKNLKNEEERVKAILEAEDKSKKKITPTKQSKAAERHIEVKKETSKDQQLQILKSLGYNDSEIKSFTLEDDRVKAILKKKPNWNIEDFEKDQKEKKSKMSKKELRVQHLTDSLTGLNKDAQVDQLLKYKYSKKEIREDLPYEKDRVGAILDRLLK